jgi:hypothetical protein
MMEITKCCSNCGSVILSLTSKPGEFLAVCDECGTVVGSAKLDKYVTVKNVCSKCNGSKFKAKVKREDDKERWTVVCANCKEEPEYRYVDSGLNDIDEKTRENLILRDTIADLNEKISRASEYSPKGVL